MLLNTSGNTQTNCTVKSQTFSIKASPVAFDILSSKLYSNPTLAMVRELLTNAYDSHKLADNLDTPIDVHFPDYLDDNFIIRDYGTGLSKEDILEMYTTFFSSTKSDSNDFTGCFGLGSKTPFSYTSSFSVNSYFNGTKYFFAAVKKDGYPHIFCMKEEETKEPNGLEIIIPTDNDNNIYIQAQEYLKYILEVKINSNKPITQLEATQLLNADPIFIRLYTTNDYNRYSYNAINSLLIKQGQNTYRITDSSMYSSSKHLTKVLKRCVISIEVPIGTLGITPSRESLATGTDDKSLLSAFIATADSLISDEIKNSQNFWIYLDETSTAELLSRKHFKNLPVEMVLGYASDTDSYSLKFPHTHMWDVTGHSVASPVSIFHANSDRYTVVVPYTIDDTGFTKLRNICKNYDICLNVITPPQNLAYQDFYQKMCEIVEIGNNIPEYSNTYLDVITYEKLLEEYPDQVQHRNVDPNRICIRYCYARIKIKSAGKIEIYNKTHTDRLVDIKNRLTVDATLVYDMKKPLSDDISLVTFADIFNLYLTKVWKDGKSLLAEWLQSKGINTDRTEYYLLGIAPSNMRHFKQYPKLKPNELFEWIKKQSYTITESFDTVENNINSYIKPLLKDLDFNFKGKTREFVINSLGYKSLEGLIKRYKHYESHNILNSPEVALLTNSGLITDKHKKKSNWPDLLPHCILRIDKCCRDKGTKYFAIPEHLKDKYLGARSGNILKTQVHKFTQNHKLMILHILKGDKNVLF